MSEHKGKAVASVRAVEIGVAGLMLVAGVVVAVDSYRLGARWGDDGPEAGYFPFYVGLLICISCGVTLVRAIGASALAKESFAERGQFMTILSVLVPTAVYVAAIVWLGLYLASTIYIAYFMRRLGRYSWLKTGAVAIGVSVVFFLVFETWFKVSLPKGPLEAALGLN